MSDKFQDKFRIPSARAIWWDYGNDAAYFVTICTGGRDHFFGEINKSFEMELLSMGELAREYWLKIPNHFPFVKLDVFVVMPNHVHGIVVIDKNSGKDEIHLVMDTFDKDNVINRDAIRDAIYRVSAQNCHGGITGENNPMLHDNLSRIIRWYKGKTTFGCHSIYAGFCWQSRFHDHIIRDEESYQNIREYILNNPVRWKNDKYNQAE